MAAVSGQGTTFNLPNYHGELFTVTPTETPFLSAIGGINGAKPTTSTSFEWQEIDRRTSSANNSVVEGAAAPAGSERARANRVNVCEIHQSAVELSYSKLAATGNFNGQNIAPLNDDVMLDELALQVQAELESIAVDVEQSFISGVFSNPGTNATARKTAGILSVAGTVSANGGTNRALSKSIIDTHLQTMYANGAKLNQASTVIMLGPAQKVALSGVYGTALLNAVQRDRTIGGVSIDTLVTDLGTFGVMLNRWMPAHSIAIVDLSVCYARFLNIPGKGLLFAEELARTGASRKFQLYGEVGLEYGPANAHGVINDLT